MNTQMPYVFKNNYANCVVDIHTTDIFLYTLEV